MGLRELTSHMLISLLSTAAIGARFINEYSPEGRGPIILDDLTCTGAEASLLLCSHNQLNLHNCGMFENVGLYCLQEEPVVEPNTSEGNLATCSNQLVG